ncbi:uncharacterized protein Z520_08777 [Fonsecaea multimorphosa CBS 102226]|uniref:Ribosomal protein S11 n=1 Tax=Fonsecaea multimorphosa CBS 102226 TaxID=1442371 RepID=A0A0D2JQM8_9EURO|nr:uncharacterized protein Z520_08777 [Fonsecaea multimorphosa CBS 102226]KIX95657.1 hypothetical protein Z520_08777 [Fonsecaea multimorphosa CBS 102226]OAL21257.1 hypothetical protein AYO22_08220 [Fonsecaea multimorphosa]
MARSRVPLLSSMCRSCRNSYLTQPRRAISDSSSSSSREPERQPSRLSERLGIKVNEEVSAKETDALSHFHELLRGSSNSSAASSTTNNSMRSIFQRDLRNVAQSAQAEAATRPSLRSSYTDEPYHINVYAHRHNTHITFTEPNRNPILSFSCGNLGLRNAQKASYDASFQLAAYTFRKMAEKQWKLGGSKSNKHNNNPWCTLSNIKKPAYSGSPGAGIEVIFRGYGPGREAFQKALLGTEGRMIKPLIAKVTDGTRLKFGGTRSPQVRRLG